MKQKIEILYQDVDIVVVNKPPHMLSIPDRYADLPNVQSYLKNKFEDIFVVHRLDKETSGIMVFARNEMAHKALSLQFQERQTEKKYLALVEGQLYPNQAEINKPIQPHPTIQKRMVVGSKGKPSLTSYEIVEKFEFFTLVEAQIYTGRTHQIRVHFESIGFPLALDKIYGRRQEIYFHEIKKGKIQLDPDNPARPLMSRTSLHALKLVFQHPTSNEK